MQPHPSQLPREDAQRPVPKNLKKGAIGLFLLVVVALVLIAFALPKKQVEAQRAGTPTQQPSPRQQRLVNEGFQKPTAQ